MRHYDLNPLYRSTIGFDRLFRLLDQTTGGETVSPSYPPYNIERTGEEAYRITMAIAGFKTDEIAIESHDHILTVNGEKAETGEDNGRVLYRGIASRAFERRFQLADHVEVTGATLENGLLHIDLKRETPEALKPRRIAISGGATVESAKVGTEAATLTNVAA